MNNWGVGVGREDKIVLKKGLWTTMEGAVLAEYVRSHGEGNLNVSKRTKGWHTARIVVGYDGLTIEDQT